MEYDCQTYPNLNHELYSMTSPRPFSVWGIDEIGRIAPKALIGHEYILVTIDYFTKWVQAASYSVLKAKHVARFIENDIIFRFGVPQEIILDNGSPFEGEVQRISYTTLSITSLHCWKILVLYLIQNTQRKQQNMDLFH